MDERFLFSQGGRAVDHLSWIKELVKAEQTMEESGVIDFSPSHDPQTHLKEDTVGFLNEVKGQFIAAASAFNQLKSSSNGRIKIYAISKTDADFMLFRNGFKLIFSMKEAGKVIVSFNHFGIGFLPGEQANEAAQRLMNENELTAQWGAFGDLVWTFENQEIKIDYLVRHYLSRFIRESTK